MTKISLFAFAIGTVLSIGACGKKDPVDDVISGLEGWKNKMCACKDKACVEKTHEDYKKWENDVLEPKMKGMKKEDVNKDKMAKGDKLDDERKECRRKYRDADAAAPAGGAPAGDGTAPPAAPTAVEAPK